MNKITLYTTEQEYQDRGAWHLRLQETRLMLHERPQTTILIKLGRGGRVVWEGTNHMRGKPYAKEL